MSDDTTPCPVPPRPRTLAGRAGRWVQKNSHWLLALLILLAWPKLQYLLEQAYAALLPGPAAAAAQQTEVAAATAVVPLGVLVSKLLAAGVVYSFALALVWLTIKTLHKVLAEWALSPDDCATGNFKTAFYQQSATWKLVLFTVFWLGLLCVFAACWYGVSNMV